ncbi:TetR/AcrR family transcriptional regulator [Pelomonas sp. KK5]|uniref:TetR/AcrR family transcriptional regulator n=1 Tax=Pelomonas sp. KK5 TaxID=1855730 RepID=UPI00097C7DAB|nr:TetR/AcrR family transcriptional regulator [Pelomonas sp. KK5]
MPARSAEYMDDMRERIITAVSDCLDEKGLANASLTDVCEKAQISRGALYVHFKSKSEMLCAVVDRAARLAGARQQFADAQALRAMLINEYSMPWSNDRDMLYSEMEFLAAARTDEALREAIRRSIDARSERIRTGMRHLRKRGELRDDLSDGAAAVTLGWFFEGMMNMKFGSEVTRDVHIDAVDALLGGMLKPKVLRALAEAAPAP